MTHKTRKGLVEDKELYLSVSGVGYSKEELDEIIDKFDIDTPEGSSGAIHALQKYMKSSIDDAADVIGKLRYRGSRNGSCGHCKRPENLSNIASSIVSGINRKISEPSRKGAQAFATGNSGAISKDVSNLLKNPTVSNKLQKTFGTETQRQQAINNENKIKENNEQIALNNKLASMTDEERQDYENNQAVNQRVKDTLAQHTQDDMYDEIMGDYNRLRASNQKRKQEMFK